MDILVIQDIAITNQQICNYKLKNGENSKKLLNKSHRWYGICMRLMLESRERLEEVSWLQNLEEDKVSWQLSIFEIFNGFKLTLLTLLTLNLGAWSI